MSELIEYLDRERLKISFSTLIIRVSSVNEYFGQLSEFVREADLYGVTNGKIHLMAEMMDPPYGLFNLADEHPIRLGLEEKKDYVIVTEQLTTSGGENPLLNKPIPELKDVPWLNSLITREGYYVWYNDRMVDIPVKRTTQKRIF
ncbi:hypothetical protein [Salinimicrobium xinjiangense]|uniref:hypothetical protein n=1 Tax=Salinimicrobium xinjiangense TaxID=438596 RepID=UPI0004095C8A|nr:hypothetical protein [Salinimicrobium xinjiangense]